MAIRLWLRFIFIALLGSPFFFIERGEASEINKIDLMPSPTSLKRMNMGQRMPAAVSTSKGEASKSFPILEYSAAGAIQSKDTDYSLTPWQGQLIQMRNPRANKSSGNSEYWFATLGHF